MLKLINDAPKYLEMDQFKEYEGELYCFTESCDGCQFINECEFEEEKVNISDHVNLRKAFTVHDGFVLFAADYSGIELRVCAMISGEPVWVDEFRKPATCPTHGDRSEQYHLNVKCSICGEKLIKADPHSATALMIYKDVFVNADKDTKKFYRQIGKTANFGLIYGGTRYTLARAANISVEDAEIVRNAFFANLKGIKKWHKSEEEKSKSQMYANTLLNRLRPIPEVQDQDYKVRAYGVRTWWNHMVQGTAADIMKLAMIKITALIEEKGWQNDCKLMLTVHDELVFEVRESMIDIIVPAIADEMLLKNLGFEWLVPLEVEVEYGRTWDVHDLYTGEPYKGNIKHTYVQTSEMLPGKGIINKQDFHKDELTVQENKVYTHKVLEKLSKIDQLILDKINDAVNTSPGDYELILEFTDGVQLKLEDRKIDLEIFKSKMI